MSPRQWSTCGPRRASPTLAFDGLASLLYVDRRGAPENRQLGFDTEGKVRLLAAIAGTARLVVSDRQWISEVNWPLREGPHSPAGKSVAVDEEAQADFLVRYFLLAAGTGRVERIDWWQLVAKGYGLCDPQADGSLRERPAFRAFATLIRELAGTTCHGALPGERPAGRSARRALHPRRRRCRRGDRRRLVDGRRDRLGAAAGTAPHRRPRRARAAARRRSRSACCRRCVTSSPLPTAEVHAPSAPAPGPRPWSAPEADQSQERRGCPPGDDGPMKLVRGTVPGRAPVNPPADLSADDRAEEKLLLLLRVGRIVASDLKLFDMLQKTADAIHELLGYPNVDLPLLDEEDPETLVVRIRGGAYKERIRHEDRIAISRGVMGAAVRERRTQVVNDVAADPRYVQPPSGLAVRAELAVPILHAGRPLGVVNVEGDRPFTAVDVQLLELVADHLAVAIENTRLFAQERRLAILEERQRLARDLHDSVTQLLFSSTLLAESLPGLLRKGIAEAAPKLERLIELNRRALGEMRGLLRELAPGGSGTDFSSRELPAPAMVMLHRHGLVEALRTELATVAAQGLAHPSRGFDLRTSVAGA